MTKDTDMRQAPQWGDPKQEDPRGTTVIEETGENTPRLNQDLCTLLSNETKKEQYADTLTPDTGVKISSLKEVNWKTRMHEPRHELKEATAASIKIYRSDLADTLSQLTQAPQQDLAPTARVPG